MKKLKAPIIFSLFLSLIVFVAAKPEYPIKYASNKPTVTKYYAHLRYHDGGFGSQDFCVYLTTVPAYTGTWVAATADITYHATMTIGTYSNSVQVTESTGDTEGCFHGNLQEDLPANGFTISNAYTTPPTMNGLTIDCSDTTVHPY